MCKRIILLLLISGFLKGEKFELNPIVKSALIPGWGEKAFANLILEFFQDKNGIDSKHAE